MVVAPVNQLRKLEYLGGANRAIQWYCPPEVGYLGTQIKVWAGREMVLAHMEAISDIEAHVATEPIQQKT